MSIIAILALAGVVLLAALVVWLASPVGISRDAGREGFQDEPASRAYDRTSSWPIFAFERYLTMRTLKRKMPKGIVLDIGCGPGYLAAKMARELQETEIVGLDINPYMVSLAKGNIARLSADYALVFGDVSALPFASGSANAVVTSLSLHHWIDPTAAFTEIYRVLAPGGRLVAFDPRRNAPRIVFLAFQIGQSLFSPPAIRRTNGAVGSLWASYTRSELRALLLAQPFEKATVTAGPGWLIADCVKARESSPGKS